ncbi:3-deoxy-7-phosphoheptulonate synthase [Myxococcus sp. K38C18041901]|uniref:3-deoxy-7-phosphoheptulonate synthase n=1 Tax=Myxococcus guangdongensis TaxID=2906760 RepID=UPI0020A776BB|nr:3-deoxy-7-phosphoheptulonate synthase [Myxococcus guangdongensis]MCP3059924.1 3-deoxy-7-phosphoheptulonate synthase [Myxococcus guangdongensis]
MIVMLEPDSPESVVSAVLQTAAQYKGVTPRPHVIEGAEFTVTEVYLLGSTAQVPTEVFEQIPGVRQVVRVSQKYRVIGRHKGQRTSTGFEYNGVTFDERSVQLFAGLCAVDTKENVETMMAALARHDIRTTRMGAYKPRTNPYEFQGLGAACLPWVFESAGKHGIKVVAMEVTHPRHIDEIRDALERSGNATGAMLQVGTRNAQNFELLKSIGQQRVFPVLFKRGMGITLEESLNACEYIASEGNPKIVFCLRGVKTHLGDPHRNMVDFAHVPVVRRLTRMPVCVDPSHAIGRADLPPDGLPDIFHAIGQGLIAGASMVLVDFHPQPEAALCDGPQALRMEQLGALQRYTQIIREAYQSAVKNGDGLTA